MVGQVLKNLGKRAVARAAIVPHRLLGGRADNTCGILMYHRIADRTDEATIPTFNVTPRRFRAQLEGLLALGYQARPLRDVIDYNARGKALPPKTFVVTFDDGYENVYQNAWPILKTLDIPATVFIATAYLDRRHPFPFDDWTAAGSAAVPAVSWRPLTTAQCWEMQRSGLVTLGTHTHTHRVFRDRPDELYNDLMVSLQLLRTRFSVTNASFAFPFGITQPDLAASAKAAGVCCSLTTEDTAVNFDADPFTWGRFCVEETDTASTMAAKLDGWYSLARQAWTQVSG